MYKAPIELLSTQMSEHKFDTEKMVIEAVFKTGVNVDKDELIRALQYDRDQYDKGYADAKADVAMEIFEEIGKILYKHTNIAIKEKSITCELAIDYIGEDIAELKKKYTEDATDICVGGKVEGKNV